MKTGDLTPRGARKLADWLRACKELGWTGEQIAGPLYDIWMEHHDENGNLRTALTVPPVSASAARAHVCGTPDAMCDTDCMNAAYDAEARNGPTDPR